MYVTLILVAGMYTAVCQPGTNFFFLGLPREISKLAAVPQRYDFLAILLRARVVSS
jgi:hypothetical protein